MAEFTPVRMTSKDGKSQVIAASAKAFKTLKFSSGYRVAEDQTKLTGPGLDNGQPTEAVEPAVVGAVVAETVVFAEVFPEATPVDEPVLVDAGGDFDNSPVVDEDAKVESAPSGKSNTRKR